MLYSAAEINQLFHVSLPQNLEISGVSIDTRTLQPQDLFIAIKGGDKDGHDFVVQASQKGAAAVIVSRKISGVDCPQIVVNDTLEAMRALGIYARQRTKAKIIAVTGSVGKTTTKELLHHCLSAFGKSECSQASYNNHWGVPLSLARLSAEADYGIFEIGMSNPGEIAPLVAMVKPDIAIITAIAPAHIGQMGSLEAIAVEKGMIYSGLDVGGLAIVPADTSFSQYLAGQAKLYTKLEPITFGESESAKIRLINYTQQNNSSSVLVKIADKQIDTTISRLGKHIAVDALIAFGVASHWSLDLEKIASQLAQLPDVSRRGHICEIIVNGNKIKVIDDSYNANLVSMMAGIELLAAVDVLPGGRRLAVIGEMLELGEFSIEHHRKVGERLNQLPIDGVYLVGGEVMQSCWMELDKSKRCANVLEAKDLLSVLPADLKNNDVILFKGSNGLKLNILVNSLINNSSSNSNISAA